MVWDHNGRIGLIEVIFGPPRRSLEQVKAPAAPLKTELLVMSCSFRDSLTPFPDGERAGDEFAAFSIAGPPGISVAGLGQPAPTSLHRMSDEKRDNSAQTMGTMMPVSTHLAVFDFLDGIESPGQGKTPMY